MNILEPITQKILKHMRENQSSFTLACRGCSKTYSVILYAIEKVKQEDSISKLIVVVVPTPIHIQVLQSRIIDIERVDVIRSFGQLEFKNKTNVSTLRIVAANDESLRGLNPTVVIYDDPAFYSNTLQTIASISCPFAHYVTSYNPRNSSFFKFINMYPTLAINWREVYNQDPEWIKRMSKTLSASDFFNEYENGRLHRNICNIE